MATLRNKRKLAAVTRETQEESLRNGQSRNTFVHRINEEYITQVSEEIEGRVSKKLSQEFSRTESRILGALTKLDEFLSNQQIHTHSETVPGTFRNTNVENQGTNEDDSQSDPHPEAGIFRGQTTQNSGPKDCRDKWIRPSCHSSSAKDINYHWLFWTSDRTSIINLVTLVPVSDYCSCLVSSRVQPCFGFLCSCLSANEIVKLQPRRDLAFLKRMRQSALASELNDAYLNLSHHRIPKNASQDVWFLLNHCLNEVTLRFLVLPSGCHFTMLSNEWNLSFGFFSQLEEI